jgi:tetratricopeptide (TPR) repeat protein
MKNVFATAVLAVVPLVLAAQDPVQVQKLFEAGKYREAIAAAGPNGPPPALYTAAQSQQKLGANDQAIATYGKLAARAPGDPWHAIGVSGQRLLQQDTAGAQQSAQQAVGQAAGMPEAHFQLGLVLAKRQDWQGAAAAFDRAADLNPTLAYAHYYGGLMHYRAKHPDRMAVHFDQFLKLAPQAPERPEVLQIMKTVKGR